MEFLKKYRIIAFRKQKEFKSKKNNVILFEGWGNRGGQYQWIKKEYSSKSSMEKEYKIMKLLIQKGINVPEIYFVKEKEIMMEYIKGDILLDYIERFERGIIKGVQINKLIKNFLDWLAKFYDAFSEDYIMEDINFRNFIVKNNKIWGLDFEDCHPGKKERDIGRICAFAISYFPLYSDWKIYFVIEFLNTSLEYFTLDIKEIKKAYKNELMAIGERRNINIDDNILNLIN